MGGAPKEVIKLIELFERNIESYKRQGYIKGFTTKDTKKHEGVFNLRFKI
jgi:ribosomal protein S8